MAPWAATAAGGRLINPPAITRAFRASHIGPLSRKAGFGLDRTIQIGTVRRTGNATGEEVGVLPPKKKPKATKLVS